MKGMGHGLQTLPSLPLPCTWPAGSRQGWSMLGRVAPSLSTQPGHLCGRGCPPGLLEHVRGFSRWAFSWPFPSRQVRLQLERVFSPASLHHSNPGWDPWRKLMFRQLLSCLHTHVIQSPFYIKWSKRSCPSGTTTPGHLSCYFLHIQMASDNIWETCRQKTEWGLGSGWAYPLFAIYYLDVPLLCFLNEWTRDKKLSVRYGKIESAIKFHQPKDSKQSGFHVMCKAGNWNKLDYFLMTMFYERISNY